jgi:hypothetical protein
MPTLTGDFLNPHFFKAVLSAVGNGLWVLVAVSAVAAVLTFASGGTAPRNWPKKDEPEAEAHH